MSAIGIVLAAHLGSCCISYFKTADRGECDFWADQDTNATEVADIGNRVFAICSRLWQKGDSLGIGVMRTLVVLLSILALLGSTTLIPAAQTSCVPTRPDAEGPFYKANAPERSRTGKGFVVTGTVKSASDCAPLADARIEWWAANPKGEYDDEHRATQKADKEGRYRYETDFPARYPGRPLHLHVRVTASGHRPLVTQIYPKAGQPSLAFDFVLARE